jgi:LPXTG-site transpeptidase (sortase) family protein
VTTLVVVPAAPAAAAGVSPAEYLNPDGSLAVLPGFSGSLDLSGWDVRLDPERGPLFQPAPATLGEWSALGGVATGMVNAVHAIAVHDGVVYVGGNFDLAGGVVNADHLAKFEGGAWSQVGDQRVNERIHAMVVNQGVLYIGGEFSAVGAVASTDHAAQYNIATDTWSDMDGGLDNIVRVMAASGSTVYVGGEFTDAGGDPNADSIATFSGGGWGSLGIGIPTGRVSAIAIDCATIYAGGNFTNVEGDANADRIVKFNGANWVSLGGLSPGLGNTVKAIVVEDGIIYAAGEFINAGGDNDADYVAMFSNSEWSALSTDVLHNTVNSMLVRDGVVYVAGLFDNADGDPNFIGKFENGTLSTLNGAISELNAQVVDIFIDGDTLYAGGDFTDASGDGNADKIAEFGLPPAAGSSSSACTSTENEPGQSSASESEPGQKTSKDIAATGTTTLQLGRLIVDVPPSAIPSGETNCRIVAQVNGEGAEYGFALDDTVWDVKIICDSGEINILFAPINVCVRPKDGNAADKQVFHRHGSGSFAALPSTALRSGYACGTTQVLSLFTLGQFGLPDTGFAPGGETALAEQPPELAYAATDILLTIPALGLEMPIVGVPMGANGWDVSWLGESAGYLYGTAFPTLTGNTALTAHVWGADNQPGPFAGLEALLHGDQFTISAWGATYTYEVRSNALYSPNSLRPLAQEEYDWVTLITCQFFDEDSGSYSFRRAVRAVLVLVD